MRERDKRETKREQVKEGEGVREETEKKKKGEERGEEMERKKEKRREGREGERTCRDVSIVLVTV